LGFLAPDTVKDEAIAAATGGNIFLRNRDGAIVVASEIPNLQWEPWTFQWAGETKLNSSERKTFHAVISLDKEEKAIAVSDELLRNPAKRIADGGADFETRAADLKPD
jgi:hypothetical protein